MRTEFEVSQMPVTLKNGGKEKGARPFRIKIILY